MKTILFVHQSSELYGSDKTLYNLVKDLAKHQMKAIVVLPEEGPLASKLKESHIKLIINPIIKLSRSTLAIKNIFKLPFQIIISLYQINKKLKNEKIDIVHSNTLAVLLGALYAKQKKITHIWHVHEIIEQPQILNSFYRRLVIYFSNHVVFNSLASFRSLTKANTVLKNKSSVIYNGVENSSPKYSNKTIKDFRKHQLKIEDEKIIIGLVGRISRWKGQILLLDAFEKLQQKFSNIHLVFVGSPPQDQHFFLSQLKNSIAAKNLESKVSIFPFTEDIEKYWASIDIAVVPSTEPEPFGLVAVEAMQKGKPVVAANHGGLVEIITHNKTGLLFEPNQLDELCSSLELLINNADLRTSLGKNGCAFVKDHFSVDDYVHHFVQRYKNVGI